MAPEAEREDRRGPMGQRRRWALLLVGVAAAVVAAIALVGFVIAPPLVERWGESWLAERLGRRVAVTDVRVNPFALSVTVENLRVFEVDGRTVFVSVPRLYVNADVASLLRRALIAREVRVESPRVRAIRIRTGDRGFNWSDLAERLQGSPSSAGEGSEGGKGGSASEAGNGAAAQRAGVSLRNVHISNGTVTYEDRVLGRRHEISGLDARVSLLSTMPEDAGREVAPSVRLRLDGARVEAAARVRRRGGGLEASGNLRMADVELARIGRELPSGPFGVRSGVLEGELDWTLSRASTTTVGIAGHVRVTNLSIPSSSGAPPVHLGTVTVDVRRAQLHTGGAAAVSAKTDVAFRVGKAGKGAVDGTFELDPVAADLRVRLRDIELAPMAPAIGRVLHAIVQAGAVSAEGHLGIAHRPARRRGRTSLRVALDGDVEVAGLSSVDPTGHAPFVGWRKLRATGVSFSAAPATLVIRKVAFEGLAVHLVHRADKTWNLPRGGPRSVRHARARGSVAVGDITLRGGSFTLLDEGVRPPFTVALDGITARASGFSSRDGQMAQVEASAHPAGAATFAVSGGVGVKGGRFAADLNASANAFSASRLTPYSVKYTGYAIEGGDLAVTTHLRIMQGQLSMDNETVVTSPKVGEKIEAGRSTKLPLPVTVSLLENRRGVINLSVPVKGSFDDPQFHLGRAFGRALRNVVLKTIASPFTIIGKVFGGGGGQDVSHVDFRAGKDRLDGSARGVVRTLAAALQDRAALVFEIEGHADPDRDGASPGHDLLVLAQRRAAVVRDALARAAPSAAQRLRVVAPKVEKGAGSRVQLLLED